MDYEHVSEPLTNTGKAADWPATTDAMAWAKEFCARFGVVEDDGTPVDDCPGLMVSWFANAIQFTKMEQPRNSALEDRIEAAKAARSVLVDTGFASSTAPELLDVIGLAQWLISGQVPGALILPDYEVTDGRGDVKHVWADGHGVVAVQDTELPDVGTEYNPAEGDEGR